MKRLNWILALAASAPALTAAMAAYADDAQSVETVVVTAEKRPEQLFQVPMTVQAISADQIANSGATDFADLSKSIAGASIVSKSTPGFETVEIRGIAAGTTGDGLVGYYLDETPFGIPNLQLSPPARLLDVSQAEVTLGPSGTIYGQGSMGGTIKLVTNKPDPTRYDFRIGLEASGTEGGGANFEGDIVANVPLVKDKLAIRVAASDEWLSGFANAPEFNEKHANPFRSSNERAEVMWTPVQSVDVLLTYWHIDNAQEFSNVLAPEGGPSYYPVFSTPTIFGTGLPAFGKPYTKGFTDVRMDLYSATLSWDTGFGTLTSNTSYIQHNLSFVDPLLYVLVNNSTFKTNSLTQEVRMTSEEGSPFKWLVGASYRDAIIHSNICYYAFTCAIDPIINVNGPLTTKSESVFGEISTQLFGDRLEPLVGLRYFEDNRYDPLVKQHVSSVNPRFNLKYNVDSDGVVYANVAKGFRSGTLQTPAQVSASIAEGIPTKGGVNPDSLWTYEIGTRWKLFGDNLLAEASVYHTDWKNIQIVFASAAVISVANAGDASIDGVDLGIDWNTPVDGLVFSAKGDLHDAHFTSAVAALAAVLPTIQKGHSVPNDPRSNFSLAADYSRPAEWLGGATLTAHADYSYRDMQQDATSGFYSGTLHEMGLRAGITWNSWKLELFGENVLNDRGPSVVTGLLSPNVKYAQQDLYPATYGIRTSVEF